MLSIFCLVYYQLQPISIPRDLVWWICDRQFVYRVYMLTIQGLNDMLFGM